MKYIFDFDDVLSHTTRSRKEHIYPKLAAAGVSLKDIDAYYAVARKSYFSVKDLIKHFSLKEELYEEIMAEIENFRNTELIEVVEKLGKENCFLVSFGQEEFQKDKINRTGIAPLFSEIIIAPENKKDSVEKICAEFPKERVLFIDDKPEHFKNLDFTKYTNLKTILFDEHGLEKLKAEIDS